MQVKGIGGEGKSMSQPKRHEALIELGWSGIRGAAHLRE